MVPNHQPLHSTQNHSAPDHVIQMVKGHQSKGQMNEDAGLILQCAKSQGV